MRPRLLQVLSGLRAAGQRADQSSRVLDLLRRLVNGEKGFKSRRSAKRRLRRYGEAAAYIARRPAHSGRLWQGLAGTAAIGSFLQHCTNPVACTGVGPGRARAPAPLSFF